MENNTLPAIASHGVDYAIRWDLSRLVSAALRFECRGVPRISQRTRAFNEGGRHDKKGRYTEGAPPATLKGLVNSPVQLTCWGSLSPWD